MFRRWLRGCLLPSALCLTAAGCTTTVESLTGGLLTGPTPASAERTDVPAPRGADALAANEQLRLHVETAREMDQAGNDEGALAEYERVLALDRGNFTAMRRLCVLYDRRGGHEDFKKAEELYRKIADARPKDPDIWSDWGYSLFLRTDKETYKENWAEAEKKLRHALQLDPQHARAHVNLGLVLGELERYDEAYREFRAAQLSEAEAHCDMAFVYWQKGRMEDAKAECRQAREKNPALAKANDMLTVLEQAGRPREKGNHVLTADREQAEHEAARRFIAGMGADNTMGSVPLPPASPPVAGLPASQTPAPIRAGGQLWMPTHPTATPLPPPPAPPPAPPAPPAPGGNAGTITWE